MKVSVSFSCELDSIEVDEKYRALCHAHISDEEEVVADELCNEMINDLENQLSTLGFNVFYIESVESDNGWILYEC